MYYKIPPCTGPFHEVIHEFVSFKRSHGYDYGRPMLYRLREIDLFFKSNGVTSPEIPEAVFELWAKKREQESAVNHRRRVLVLIGFAKFMVSRGYGNVYVGELAGKYSASRFIPYIFTKDEIKAIFAVLRNRIAQNLCDTEAAAFSMLFCLYYGCGLRKMEALKLTMGDIDTVTGNIRIMDSKNHVSRLVLASDSIRQQLSDYCGRFRIGCDKDMPLFILQNGSAFGEYKLYRNYTRVMVEAGIKPRESGRLPRLHDLRHTFCVHTLEAMAQKGFDLYVSLPLLTAYLGHNCISETEYYLRLVEENFSAVTTASQKYAPTLFPKVGVTHEE
jgi:integrase